MDIKQSSEFYYRVEPNDAIEMLCLKYNTCKQNIIRNNKELDLYAGEWIIIKQNDYITHIVKPAETINDIAKTYNINIEQIIKDNNLMKEKLFIGQTIKIYK